MSATAIYFRATGGISTTAMSCALYDKITKLWYDFVAATFSSSPGANRLKAMTPNAAEPLAFEYDLVTTGNAAVLDGPYQKFYYDLTSGSILAGVEDDYVVGGQGDLAPGTATVSGDTVNSIAAATAALVGTSQPIPARNNPTNQQL